MNLTNLTLKTLGLFGLYITLVLVTWFVARSSKGTMKRWANTVLKKLTKNYLGE